MSRANISISWQLAHSLLSESKSQVAQCTGVVCGGAAAIAYCTV